MGLAGGLALGAGVLAGFNEVLDRDQIEDRLAAQLDLPRDRIVELADLATGIYEDAWGESLGQVTQDLSDVTRAVGDLGDQALRDATTRAMDFAAAFDEDVPEAIRAAQNLVANGLAPDIEAAQDLLASGFQRGLDIADDLLDTVNEYAAPLADLGLTGADIFAGLQGSLATGTRDTDKIVDSIKEFRVLALEERGRTAIELLGLDSDAIAAAVAEGGPAARDALLTVLEELRGVADRESQELLGRDIFGTMFEDATATGILAFDPLTGTFDEVAGAAQDLSDELNDNLLVTGREIVRTGMGGLIDFIEGPVIGTLTSWKDALQEGGVEGLLEEITTDLEGGADDISRAVQTWVPAAITWVGDTIEEMTDELPGILDAFGDWALNDAWPEIVDTGKELAGAAVDWVSQAAEDIGPELGTYLGVITAWILTDAIPGLLIMGGQLAVALTEWIVTDAIPALPELQRQFALAIEAFVVTLATEIETSVREDWVPALLAWAPDAVKGFVSELATISGTIRMWVQGLTADVALWGIDVFEGLYTAFAKSWNRIVDFVNEQGDIVTIGGVTIGAPDIPRAPVPSGPEPTGRPDGPGGQLVETAADGALLTQPTLILAAEVPRAQPEIVSPVDLMRRIVREESGDQGATQNFYGDLTFTLDGGDDPKDRLAQVGRRFSS